MPKSHDPHVLIVSTKVDIATDAVIRILAANGVRLTRVNTEDFPFDSTLTTAVNPHGVMSIAFHPGRMPETSLHNVSTIWFRRIRSPEPPTDMHQGVYDYCQSEANAALVGTVLGLNSRIMSPPARIWAAEHKLLQLSMAHSVGLELPESVVTNDPAVVRQAFSHFGKRMIIKPVRSGFVDYGTEHRAIFTSQVLEDHLSEIDSARWSPAIYQPLIPKRHDIRVTVVGSQFFVAAIDSQSDSAAAVDWRRTDNPRLPHHSVSLPLNLRHAVLRLMRRLGLVFAALDFILTPDGRYIFLEVNPNGQWLWLDDILDFGISSAVADWLARSPR